MWPVWAKIFNNNGKGVRGDLAAVFKAILLDPEALDAASLKSNTFGKLREPMVRIAQWAHTFKVKSTRNTLENGCTHLVGCGISGPKAHCKRRLFSTFSGQAMCRLQPPWPLPALQRLNFSWSMRAQCPPTSTTFKPSCTEAFGSERLSWPAIPKIRPPPTAPDIVPDYGFEFGLTDNADTLVQHLNLLLCAGQLSAQTVGHITDALRNESVSVSAPENALRNHVSRALLFVMCSSDYLIQR